MFPNFDDFGKKLLEAKNDIVSRVAAQGRRNLRAQIAAQFMAVQLKTKPSVAMDQYGDQAQGVIDRSVSLTDRLLMKLDSYESKSTS